jgi:tetratricopeptide (TPR) repeat protein
MGLAVRLVGWKEIARYMKRDRSTVIRWKAYGIPVHSIPGSSSGSVYAFADELDAWLAKGSTAVSVEAPATAPSGQLRVSSLAITWGKAAAVAAAVGIAGLIAIAALVLNESPTKTGVATVKLDPATEHLYVKARVDWASRTPVGLRNAIDELNTVIGRQPKFADAYAALADAYLLSPEFGVMPPPDAFANAELAARHALAIDPDSAGANRAMGFIAYWQRQDNTAARRYFLQALDIAPGSAQTHLWYGNTLMNNGDLSAGLTQLEAARRLEPESPAIETDYAIARWDVGSDAEAIAILQNVEARAPTLSTAPYELSLISFVRGDWARYLWETEKVARLRGDADQLARIGEQKSAFARLGPKGLLESISPATPPQTLSVGDRTIYAAAAAALLGRRDRLLASLVHAEAHGEIWMPRGRLLTLFQKWWADPEIAGRLHRLFGRGKSTERLAP